MGASARGASAGRVAQPASDRAMSGVAASRRRRVDMVISEASPLMDREWPLAAGRASGWPAERSGPEADAIEPPGAFEPLDLEILGVETCGRARAHDLGADVPAGLPHDDPSVGDRLPQRGADGLGVVGQLPTLAQGIGNAVDQ